MHENAFGALFVSVVPSLRGGIGTGFPLGAILFDILDLDTAAALNPLGQRRFDKRIDIAVKNR